MPNDPSKQITVEYTSEFKRNLRQLAKKYRHVKSDIAPIIKKLKAGKALGDQIQGIGDKVFKVRARNSDAKKGKRGGYRLIYYLKIESKVLLITIYSKTEQDDVSSDKIKRIISDSEPPEK